MSCSSNTCSTGQFCRFDPYTGQNICSNSTCQRDILCEEGFQCSVSRGVLSCTQEATPLTRNQLLALFLSVLFFIVVFVAFIVILIKK